MKLAIWKLTQDGRQAFFTRLAIFFPLVPFKRNLMRIEGDVRKNGMKEHMECTFLGPVRPLAILLLCLAAS